MTNYNDGKWHGWNGGECPVHPETVVLVQFWNGQDTELAKNWDWARPASELGCINAFRVIKEHKEPREFWLAFNQKGEAADYSEHIDELGHMEGWTSALFREVLE